MKPSSAPNEDAKALGVQAAEVCLPCSDLDSSVAFCVERLGLRLETIFPADDPRVAVVSGHGLRLRLERGRPTAPLCLRLSCANPAALGAVGPGGQEVQGGELVGPDGLRVLLAPLERLEVPELVPAFVLTRARAGEWQAGRAGMQYRDLLPERQGGRFVASHIRIPHGGPVPDYVHYHDVRFQMIYCRAGWVRVVYEDQGPSFVLEAGDCVLQPPRIRHRVLACSDGLAVIEVGCPALHATLVEHELELPSSTLAPLRDFAGQVFVRHVAQQGAWAPSPLAGFEARDLGLAAATRGLGGARVLRRAGELQADATRHAGELYLGYVLAGSAQLSCAGSHGLGVDDCVAIPPGTDWAWLEASPDFEWLEVTLPASAQPPGIG